MDHGRLDATGPQQRLDVGVAPPLQFGPTPCAAGGDPRPVLVLAAEHDQFTSPDQLRDATATWADATVTVVDGVDHFLAGATGRVAEAVLDWIRQRALPKFEAPGKCGVRPPRRLLGGDRDQ